MREGLKNIVVDVTATLSLNRLTGVQRIVMRLADRNDVISLIRFNQDSGEFELLEEMPALKYSSTRTPRSSRWVIRALQQMMWSALKLALPAGHYKVIQRIERFGSRIFSRRISEFSGFDSEVSVVRAVVPEEIESLWVLDIPKSSKHRDKLRYLMTAERTRVFFYVYDLIPIDNHQFLAGKEHQRSSADFIDYLNLVTSSNGILCLSNFTRRRLQEFMIDTEVRTQPSIATAYPPLDGFEMETDSTADDYSSTVLNSMNVADNTRLILAVAPLIRRKNLDVLFRATKSLLDRGENVALVVVAPILSTVDIGTTMRGLWLVFRYRRNVKILNPVSEETLRGLYGNATLVAVPSLLEGYGLPIIEAYHFKKRVLISEAEVLREVAGSQNALVLKSRDAGEWAKAMLSSPTNFISSDENMPLTGVQAFIDRMLEMQIALEHE